MTVPEAIRHAPAVGTEIGCGTAIAVPHRVYRGTFCGGGGTCPVREKPWCGKTSQGTGARDGCRRADAVEAGAKRIGGDSEDAERIGAPGGGVKVGGVSGRL